MIEMHQAKQERVDDFWLDLEGVNGSEAFDVLRNRGKWESSLWKAGACRPFVDEESRSTRHLDESLGWNEDAFKVFVKMLAGKVQGLSEVVAVYRAHSPIYRGLVAQIVATSILATRSLSSYSSAISSTAGAIILHGPHHPAQKSTRVGVSACSTSASNVASVTSTGLAIDSSLDIRRLSYR
jgi:hypothetical protein